MSLDCREAQVRLAARRLSELDMAEQRALDEHLRGCAECWARDSAASAMADLLRRETPPLGDLARERVWREIAKAPEARPASGRRFGALTWAGAALAAAALLLLSLWLGAFSSTPSTRRRTTVSRRAGASPKSSSAAGAKKTPVATAAANAGSASARPRADSVRVFRLLAHAGLEVSGAPAHALTAGARLSVAAGGGALLASDDTLLWLEGASRLRIGPRGATVTLELGRLHLRTRDGGDDARQRPELAVVVGTSAGLWRAQPVGTQYSVARDARGTARVSVYAGRVAIRRARPAARARVSGGSGQGSAASRPGATRGFVAARTRETAGGLALADELRAGESLASDGSRERTSSKRPPLERVEALASAAGGQPGSTRVEAPARCVRVAGIALACGHATLQVGVDAAALRQLDTRVGKVVTSASTTSGSRHVASATAKRGASRGPAPTPAPAAASPSGKPCAVGPLERLLAAGATKQARTLANTREARCGSDKAAYFSTIVAESFAREHRYALAIVKYRMIYLAHRRSTLGMNALYNAGSLLLEKRKRARAAAKVFALYLRSYPRGPQREDATYMLWRAQRAARQLGAARATARRYHARYPRGRYRGRIPR